MCGITGFVGQGNKDILKKMADSLYHRGPDDEGFFIEHGVGFGFRRLSIIDLTSGNQPILNEDKTIAVIFNGEIYNYLILKEDLLKNGHIFNSKTDTEVIVHLYEEVGEKVFEKLNGMFAIAIWDKRKKKLILGRDRMGKKPLYYSVFENTFIFGSELKSLLCHPKVKKEIDWTSFYKYLCYEYVPTPHSIFKNIYKLPPGHYMVYKNGFCTIKQYWDLGFHSQYTIRNSQSKNYINELDRLLDEAVRIRLMSDVPLGVFLSGGIDSSTIAYYAQKNSQHTINTFSIAFEDKSFDESLYAKEVARYLGTKHHETRFTQKELLDRIPQLATLIDEPFADASIIPTYLLSQYTKQHVTVSLGGDGGDELLMGYPTFQAEKIFQILKKFPRFITGFFEKCVHMLPVSFKNISFDFKLKKFFSALNYPDSFRHQIWLGSFYPEYINTILKPEILHLIKPKSCFEDIEQLLSTHTGNSFFEQINYLYCKHYLQDDILVKVDRASMYASLEVRAPFLDFHVVDFLTQLPAELKLRGFTTKYILKKLMENKLPHNIIYRPKKGFGIPLAKWINNELKNFTLEILSEENIKKQGIFEYNIIKKILNEHFSKKKDNRKYIWTLMAWQMWYEKYGK